MASAEHGEASFLPEQSRADWLVLFLFFPLVLLIAALSEMGG